MIKNPEKIAGRRGEKRRAGRGDKWGSVSGEKFSRPRWARNEAAFHRVRKEVRGEGRKTGGRANVGGHYTRVKWKLHGTRRGVYL